MFFPKPCYHGNHMTLSVEHSKLKSTVLFRKRVKVAQNSFQMMGRYSHSLSLMLQSWYQNTAPKKLIIGDHVIVFVT